MFHKQRRQPDMATTRQPRLLAPIHLFAIATAKGGIEARHAAKPTCIDRHAKSHACGGRRQGIGPVQALSDVIDPIHHARRQWHRFANKGDGKDLGIIRHRRDRGDTQITVERRDQTRCPIGGDHGIGIEQNDMSSMPLGHRETTIDRADETQILFQFQQGDASAMLIGPSAQKRADPCIRRCVIDQDEMPSDIRVRRHAPQTGHQHLESVMDRNDDRDRMLRARGWPLGQKACIDGQPFGVRLQSEQMLDPCPCRGIPQHRPADHGRQCTAQIDDECAQKSAAGSRAWRVGGMCDRQGDLLPVTDLDMQRQIARGFGDIDLEPAIDRQAETVHHIGSLDMRRCLNPTTGPADVQFMRAGPPNDPRHPVGTPDPLDMPKPLAAMAWQRKTRQPIGMARGIAHIKGV